MTLTTYAAAAADLARAFATHDLKHDLCAGLVVDGVLWQARDDGVAWRLEVVIDGRAYDADAPVGELGLTPWSMLPPAAREALEHVLRLRVGRRVVPFVRR